MKLRTTWTLPVGLLLLAGLAGCPTKTPTTTPAKKAAPLPGCQVERLEDAEQAIRQLHGNSQAYVYKIDGDLATCKLEVFYKPDEEAEETLVWSAIGDSAVDDVKSHVEFSDSKVDLHKYHHVLAIVVPEYPSKPDDQFVLSFSVLQTPRGTGTVPCQTFRDAKAAEELFPDLVLAPSQLHFGGEITPPQHEHVKPGEEAILVSWHADKRDKNEAEEGRLKKVDRVRYRVTVTCLEGAKLPAASNQEKGEQESR